MIFSLLLIKILVYWVWIRISNNECMKLEKLINYIGINIVFSMNNELKRINTILV